LLRADFCILYLIAEQVILVHFENRFSKGKGRASLSGMRKIMMKIATVWDIGVGRRGPGTWGTLAAVPLYVVLSFLPWWAYMVSTLGLIVLAIVASEIYEQESGTHDLPQVVIDEVVGFLVTMVLIPRTWQSILAGFFLFRVLDIWKPFPIRWVDRRVHGGVGVVADDLLAGVIANLILQVLYTQTYLLGLRLMI
jgi:phosphatidylglycerophosphatase A